MTFRPILPKPGLPSRPSKSNEPPEDRPPSRPRRRRTEAIPSACSSCRQRKTKCDGGRPQCGSCRRGKRSCFYNLPEGVTPRAAREQRLSALSESNRQLLTAFESIRSDPQDRSAALVERIRNAPSVDSALGFLSDAMLLLPPPPQQQEEQTSSDMLSWCSDPTSPRSGDPGTQSHQRNGSSSSSLSSGLWPMQVQELGLQRRESSPIPAEGRAESTPKP